MASGASPSFQALPRKIASLEQIVLLACICALFIASNACSTLTGQNSSAAQLANRGSGAIRVSVQPASPTLVPTAVQFTATAEGTSNTAVTGSASAGTISGNGLFRAPKTATATQVTVTATTVADSSQFSTSAVNIRPWPPLGIQTSSLSEAVVNTAYNTVLGASGETPPYNWTISKGSLAPGIELKAEDGGLSGAASQTVSPATNSNFDGPAELPRIYMKTGLDDTPAPGSVITVNSGGDLQGALNRANCGDTIALQAGATFAGLYTLPAKACDDAHWIIIRTSASDKALPPEGTRLTPCYAGVASLPGRPDFHCTSTNDVMAKIVFNGLGGSGPIFLAQGANHYRFIGIEITREPSSASVATLAGPEPKVATDHIIFDRVWIHGTAQSETRRGVGLGGTYMAVVDSFLSDFHCVALGTCTDSQAVAGGGGDLPMGPYKIVNNFLEAAGENILFGGGAATQTPTDIEIRQNHLFKPLLWMSGQAGFIGGTNGKSFIVKNLFELKNAQRVLFDSNVLEYAWGGFSQFGYAVVITPKNQSINEVNVCPLCQVTDVTVRYVTISHVAGAFQIANALAPPAGVALQGQRYSIHDVIADDIDGLKFRGGGIFAEISTIPEPLLQSVQINHITAFPPAMLFNVGGPASVKMPGFVFTNSIVTSGQYPIWSTGAFGISDCAYYDVPITTLNACFTAYSFSYNAIIGTGAQYPPSKWPAGNFFHASPAALDFVNFNNGNGGDYRLLPSSPGKAAAGDGLDLGANAEAVYQAIAGVRE
jgi:hypothetical protein